MCFLGGFLIYISKLSFQKGIIRNADSNRGTHTLNHCVIIMDTFSKVLETYFNKIVECWDVLNPLTVIGYDADEEICLKKLKKKFM